MKRVFRRRAMAAMTVFACLLAAPASVATATATAAAKPKAQAPAEPIVLIVLENKSYSDIVGNSKNAPYLQSLIAAGTLYTNYQAAPGSLPDYLRMTGGIETTSAAKGSDNIFNQLQGQGTSWGEYMESMPKACYTKTGPKPYDKNHNAAVWYNDITSKPAACANMLPFTAFDPAHPRAFSYVVPNDSDNMHDGSSRTAQIQAGDAWLAANVPAMLKGGAMVIVTWDEAHSTSNEHIATIAVGGSAKAGAKDAGAYTHYGLLAGLEDVFGVPLLNAAETATPVPIK
jgi:phosphatidylinositol-3-phosphatase